MKKKLKERYGSTALIAGASEGLGAAYALALAKEGFDLVLIARQGELLQRTASIIKGKFGVNVACIICDLGNPNALDQTLQFLGPTEIDFLVYNAAQSFIGPFLEEKSGYAAMTTTNMITPLKMTRHFGGKMVARGRGGIIIMTSLAAFQGSPFISTYSATKAFLLTLAEGLSFEWKNTGVDVIACCAGATATPNYIKSNPTQSGWSPRVQLPEEVVTECLQEMGKTPSLITGGENRVTSFVMRRILPRKWAVAIMGRAAKKMYKINS